jgi:hypothetical protein
MVNDSRPFGPLTPYIGVWTGSGIDTVPDGKGGATRTPFLQQLTFEAVPLLTYGAQTVRGLRYACVDWATDDSSQPATMFPVYEESGYYLWLPDQDTVALQLANPRGLQALAMGAPAPDDSFTVTTAGGSDGRGVLVAASLRPFANVVGYETKVRLTSDGALHYANDTLLQLADGSIFHQTDITTLRRYS